MPGWVVSDPALTRAPQRLTPAQVDRIIAGTKIGGANRGAANLAAAKDFLAGGARTIQQAADRHRVLRQSVARVVYQVRRLAEDEARRGGGVHVGVLIPREALPELAAWVVARGGEVVV